MQLFSVLLITPSFLIFLSVLSIYHKISSLKYMLISISLFKFLNFCYSYESIAFMPGFR